MAEVVLPPPRHPRVARTLPATVTTSPYRQERALQNVKEVQRGQGERKSILVGGGVGGRTANAVPDRNNIYLTSCCIVSREEEEDGE